MILFKGRCKYCEEDIALYDFDNKVIYLRDVVPSFIG